MIKAPPIYPIMAPDKPMLFAKKTVPSIAKKGRYIPLNDMAYLIFFRERKVSVAL